MGKKEKEGKEEDFEGKAEPRLCSRSWRYVTHPFVNDFRFLITRL